MDPLVEVASRCRGAARALRGLVTTRVEEQTSFVPCRSFCLTSVSHTWVRMTHTSRRPRRPTTGPSSSASRSPCSRRASSGARRPWSAPQGKRRHSPITLYLAIDERQYRATCFHMTGPHLRCDGRGRPSSAVQPPDDATQEGRELNSSAGLTASYHCQGRGSEGAWRSGGRARDVLARKVYVGWQGTLWGWSKGIS